MVETAHRSPRPDNPPPLQTPPVRPPAEATQVQTRTSTSSSRIVPVITTSQRLTSTADVKSVEDDPAATDAPVDTERGQTGTLPLPLDGSEPTTRSLASSPGKMPVEASPNTNLQGNTADLVATASNKQSVLEAQEVVRITDSNGSVTLSTGYISALADPSLASNGESLSSIATEQGVRPPTDSTEAGEPNAGGSNKMIGATVGAVIAVLILVALVIFCIRQQRKRRDTRIIREQAGRMPIPQYLEDEHDNWAKFSRHSAVVEKESPSAREVEGEDATDAGLHDGMVPRMLETLEAMSLATATNASDQSDHRLYSYFQEVMPPPSMRSKRYSRNTIRTVKSDDAPPSQSDFDTFHTMDSQTQLPSPYGRPLSSSAFSINAPPLVRSESAAAAPAQPSPQLYHAVGPEQPGQKPTLPSEGDSLSRKSSARSGTNTSRSSTMTDFSLGAVGSDSIGRAL